MNQKTLNHLLWSHLFSGVSSKQILRLYEQTESVVQIPVWPWPGMPHLGLSFSRVTQQTPCWHRPAARKRSSCTRQAACLVNGRTWTEAKASSSSKHSRFHWFTALPYLLEAGSMCSVWCGRASSALRRLHLFPLGSTLASVSFGLKRKKFGNLIWA